MSRPKELDQPAGTDFDPTTFGITDAEVFMQGWSNATLHAIVAACRDRLIMVAIGAAPMSIAVHSFGRWTRRRHLTWDETDAMYLAELMLERGVGVVGLTMVRPTLAPPVGWSGLISSAPATIECQTLTRHGHRSAAAADIITSRNGWTLQKWRTQPDLPVPGLLANAIALMPRRRRRWLKM